MADVSFQSANVILSSLARKKMGTYKILQFYLRITCKDTENSVSCGNVLALDYAF